MRIKLLAVFSTLLALGYATQIHAQDSTPSSGLDLVKLHMNAVLGHRVQELIVARKSMIQLTSVANSGSAYEMIEWKSDVTRLLKGTEFQGAYRSLTESSVIALLDLYRRSEAFKEISKQGNRAQREIERKKFEIVPQLLVGYAISPWDDLIDFITGDENSGFKDLALYFKLDPYCAQSVIPLFQYKDKKIQQGYLDSNPCQALDYDLMSTVRKSTLIQNSSQWVKWYQSFVDRLWAESQIQNVGPVDLLKVANPQLPYSLLALSTVAISEFALKPEGGYMDGFGDVLWRDGMKAGELPQTVLQNFYEFKFLLASYQLMRDEAQTSSSVRKFNFVGYDQKFLNRHDYVSTYFSCALREIDEDQLASTLPLMLGRVYESLDFVSHLKDGVSLSEAFKNFKTDTYRYARGMKIASVVCR